MRASRWRSYICTSFLSELSFSKVVLTGEGADEVFGGYSYLLPDFLRHTDTLTPILYPSLMPLPTLPERMDILKAFSSRSHGQDHSLSDMSLTDCKMGREMLGGLLTPRLMGTSSPPAEFFERGVIRKWGSPDITKSIAEEMSVGARRKIKDGRWHALHGALVSTVSFVCSFMTMTVDHSMWPIKRCWETLSSISWAIE
jgi:asparagine synthase (glutamine-hydrolysing)